MNGLSQATCEDVFARLADYLDRELSDTEMQIVEEHLGICEVCASEFRFEESVLAGIKRGVRRSDIPEPLRRRVLSLVGRMTPGGGPPSD